MAGTVVADTLQAASTSTLVIKNGVANTPPTVQDSAGTQIGTFCRAWVNFNGTGTVAIRASFNVTSITDNGTGDYTVNFTNALPDANYATQINGEGNPSGTANFYLYGLQSSTGQSSGSVRVSSFRNGAGVQDSNVINVAIFR